MDRRTILAFALMFVVMIGWNMMFGPKPDPNATDPETQALQEVVTTPTPSEKPVISNPVEEREPVATSTGSSSWSTVGNDSGIPIQILTDQFVAEIDPVGGDIVSWKLSDYDRIDGHPVDLVSPRSLELGTQSAHGLRLIFEDHEVDLSRVEFQADRSGLDLSDNNPLGEVRFTATANGGGQLELVYRFANGHYGYDVEAIYRAESSLLSPKLLQVKWPGGIANSEPDTTREYQEFRALTGLGEDVQKKKFDSLKGDGAKGRARYDGVLRWAGVESQYFASLVFSADPKPGVVRFDGDHSQRIQSFEAELAFAREATSVLRYGVYMGPIDPESLSYYKTAPYSVNTDALIDMGPSIFHFVAKPTLWSLKFLYGIIPNYGLVIIIFSAFTKLLFYPLTKSSTESMRKMQTVQPKMQAIKEKFKDDQQKQSQEMMKLYKEEGINPMGGCLPLLVQMPVFIALFNILRKTVELRQAEFMWWMNDLSQPDVLFNLPVTLPILGNNFCVLPILMAASMWLQTKMSQSGQAPTTGGGAMAQQMKMMGTLMPVMMFVIFYNSPSGLVLYWFVNTVLTAAQTWHIHRKMNPAVSVGGEAEVKPA